MTLTVPVQSDDGPFLFDLYVSTRCEEIASWGWSPTEQRAFLEMQYRVRQRAYALQFPESERRVILHDGHRVGSLDVFYGRHEMRLVDIALMPEFRGAGIGTAVIRELQARADATKVPLRLTVGVANRVRRLYERLGFAVTAETEMDLFMEWSSKTPERK